MPFTGHGMARQQFKCPHCGSGTQVRTSRLVTPHFREIHFLCRNDSCSCTFVGELSIARITRLPANADPDCPIPVTAVRTRPSNDNHPARGPEVPPAIAANDDEDFGEATASA